MKINDFSFTSTHTQYTYTISYYIPADPQPPEGFPVCYVLDGSSYTMMMAEAVRLQSRNTLRTHVAPSIVIGIGHQDDMRDRRFFDFTAPADAYKYPERFKGDVERQHGGAEAFTRFIEQELKPEVMRRFPINQRKQTLYGHSLGGYFTFWQWLHHNDNYAHYLAISPSLWWNDHHLFTDITTHPFTHTTTSLFMAVGEHEGHMVIDAKKMLPYVEQKTTTTSLYIAPDENHASVVPTTMSRALRFIHV